MSVGHPAPLLVMSGKADNVVGVRSDFFIRTIGSRPSSQGHWRRRPARDAGWQMMKGKVPHLLSSHRCGRAPHLLSSIWSADKGIGGMTMSEAHEATVAA
eukprot:4835483-Amphidinium_carterae.2